MPVRCYTWNGFPSKLNRNTVYQALKKLTRQRLRNKASVATWRYSCSGRGRHSLFIQIRVAHPQCDWTFRMLTLKYNQLTNSKLDETQLICLSLNIFISLSWNHAVFWLGCCSTTWITNKLSTMHLVVLLTVHRCDWDIFATLVYTLYIHMTK